jgi:hypothetical protein
VAAMGGWNGALAAIDGGCSGAAGGIAITSGVPHTVQKCEPAKPGPCPFGHMNSGAAVSTGLPMRVTDQTCSG